MKVHLVSTDSSNGANRVAAELAERLAKVVDVRTTSIRQRGGRVGGYLSLWLQKHLVKKEPGEILHVIGMMPFSVENCDLMTVYDIFSFHYLHMWADSIPKTIARWMEYQSISTAPRIHAISEATKRDLVIYCGRVAESIFVVPLGTDMEKFHIQDVEKLSNTVLYVGDDHPRKNLKRLVRALSLIDPSPTLLWVGGRLYMRERADVRDLAAVLQVPLVETGRISDEELVEYYNRVAILVHPPLNSDGFGLSPIEASACGTLAVVSDVPPFRENLGPLAVYFDPEDVDDMAEAIEFALEHSAETQRLKQILRDNVRRFDWDRIITQLLEVYQRISEPLNMSEPCSEVGC